MGKRNKKKQNVPEEEPIEVVESVLKQAPNYYKNYISNAIEQIQEDNNSVTQINVDELNFALMLVLDGEIIMTRVNDTCHDQSMKAMQKYCKLRLVKKLPESEPVVIKELYKHDSNGEDLPKDKRGINVDGVVYRLWLGIYGFPKEVRYSVVQATNKVIPFRGLLWQLDEFDAEKIN